MNTTEVSTAGKKAVERDKGKKDNGKTGTAAVAGILAADDMVMDLGMGFEAAAERCGSLEPAICGM
jgi:hypothetical protein